MPDMAGATAVVTGASDGIGLEIAQALAGSGAAVILPVRNREKGQRAVARIRESVPDARLALRDLDLARLDTVAALVQALRDESARIDHLVLNAGVILLGDRERHVTEDGFELHFQTNFLGHYALTLGLLPLLRTSRGRVVVQTSLATRFGRVAWDDLQLQHRYSAFRAYASSKAALGLFATEFARRSDDEAWGVTLGISHPGVAPDTSIAGPLRAKRTGSGSHKVSARLGHSPAEAALPALMAMMSTPRPGEMCVPRYEISGQPKRRRIYRRISDPAAAARIWDVGDRLLVERPAE
ncbi:MAG: SDR family oxidoreductase [Propionibacterium sp.]|nr:SDR family oxidoreductase [Propionibacterium sp.]